MHTRSFSSWDLRWFFWVRRWWCGVETVSNHIVVWAHIRCFSIYLRLPFDEKGGLFAHWWSPHTFVVFLSRDQFRGLFIWLYFYKVLLENSSSCSYLLVHFRLFSSQFRFQDFEWYPLTNHFRLRFPSTFSWWCWVELHIRWAWWFGNRSLCYTSSRLQTFLLPISLTRFLNGIVVFVGGWFH